MNNELQKAQILIEQTGMNVLLLGKAGTGKTTFLRNLYNRHMKRMIILAPTGVAAMNAGGTTIHSFFQLPLSPFVPDTHFKTNDKAAQHRFRFSKEKRAIIRSLDLLVIDEISMVRADLLDAIDSVLRQYRDRTRPFGGVQMLMIGDMQQLAPVAREEEWNILRKYYDTPYFFSSKALQETDFVTVELQHVYRQSDPTFLNILNKVDRIEGERPIETEDCVLVSAVTGEGLDRMLKKIEKLLPPSQRRMTLLIPYADGSLSAAIRENGRIFSEEFTEKGVLTDALVDVKLLSRAEPYQI